MGDEQRRIAIAIGVADSVPRKYLGGAVNGAKAFAEWAEQQGYETALITEAEAPVDMARLRREMEAILTAGDGSKPIQRIIVYFAGHGLIRELEEGLWLLSDWQKELRAVAVEVLKRRLTMYRPAQIAIISDACRSLPANRDQADLVPDAVLGSGPRPADPTVEVDKFIAALDAEEAFMIPGGEPEEDRCLFSGVLLEGLWGLPGQKCRPFSKAFENRITSRSLSEYLKTEVAARAEEYGIEVTPVITPTFGEGKDEYLIFTADLKPPKFPPWPDKEQFAGMSAGRAAGFEPDAEILRVIKAPPARVVRTLDEHILPDLTQGRVGVGIGPGDSARLWAPPGLDVRRLESANGWAVSMQDGSYLAGPVQALVEYDDGRIATPVLMRPLFLSLARDTYGVSAAMYRDLQARRTEDEATIDALTALEKGTLRAETASNFAVKLRRGKHADPVLGVIAAYLYDAIGDVESIRRMASFFPENHQPIPYDIALLGGLDARWTGTQFEVDVPELEARDARTAEEAAEDWTHCHRDQVDGVVVAGLWPWMRQGWTFLDDPSDVGSPLVNPALVRIRPLLMRSRFTTFEAGAAGELATIAGVSPV